MLVFLIPDMQIQIISKFNTTKSINTYLNFEGIKIPSHANFGIYRLCNATPNRIQKYRIL